MKTSPPPNGHKPIPKPRTDRPLQIPKIKELNQALKGHVKSYEIELKDNLNPLNHFTKTRPLTESLTPRGPFKNHERILIHSNTGGNV